MRTLFEGVHTSLLRSEGSFNMSEIRTDLELSIISIRVSYVSVFFFSEFLLSCLSLGVSFILKGGRRVAHAIVSGKKV